MTTTSGEPIPHDDDDATGSPPGAGSSQPDGAPGVELGMSEESGGTFEPEEDPEQE
ncbi:hypothetical protein [Modestobacter lapidis]|nr:hypothetical protein [Modestobacter lapidis]